MSTLVVMSVSYQPAGNNMGKRKSDAIAYDAESNVPTPPENRSLASSQCSSQGPQSPQSTTLVDDVNALDCDQFRSQYWHPQYHEHGTHLGRSVATLVFAKHLLEPQLNQCFHLIESTSRPDYQGSSFGWHPKRKRREMMQTEMRYILVRKEVKGEELQTATDAEFEGFMSFMVTHDSIPSVPVLYIYEIHLTEAARGRGLGQFLMKTADSLGRSIGVDKVMLTCFLSNTKARDFYERLGYVRDSSSPSDRKIRNKLVKTDYVLMSKETRSVYDSIDEHNRVVQVTRAASTCVSPSLDANKFPSLEDCPEILRGWTKALESRDMLQVGLEYAEGARESLSNHNEDQAMTLTTVLQAVHRTLHTRWEAARDLGEVLREQTYHLQSQISDLARLAETMKPILGQRSERSWREVTIDEGNFDIEQSTEQVYSAFYTLMRKADEIDNRLDDLAEREQEAELLESDLDEREEELDGWERDLHQREAALAMRENRLMRARSRFTRRQVRLGLRDQSEVYRQVEDNHHTASDSCECERERALPWRQESLPRDKVKSWLWHDNCPGDSVIVAAAAAAVATNEHEHS